MRKAKKVNPTSVAMKKAAWQATVQDMRDGRIQRASTFVNRKKEGDRKACRGRVAV